MISEKKRQHLQNYTEIRNEIESQRSELNSREAAEFELLSDRLAEAEDIEAPKEKRTMWQYCQSIIDGIRAQDRNHP